MMHRGAGQMQEMVAWLKPKRRALNWGNGRIVKRDFDGPKQTLCLVEQQKNQARV
jgi:hypothetical protein